MDNTDTGETLSICRKYFESNKNNLIFFMNAHCFNIAQKKSDYKQALNKSDMLLNDGIGIKMGAKFKGLRIRENMNGTDFIPRLLELARDLNKNVYLLGGEEGIAKSAARKLELKFPGINIVGTRNGFFDFFDDHEILADIIERKTDLLVVGMGVPRQELWLQKNKEKLSGVQISIAGGAILDFISEKVSRAPLWMRKSGTEWIFRFLQEPKRLFKRYFIGIPEFYINLLKAR
jgi:N-acetylglucosaminyldiphosphoundecaprenol N-acetyl-beta-D-mannosaminyltransferase